jgi:hypothetical protein
VSGDLIEFEDPTGTRDVLVGQLKDPAGATGQVLTVNADKTISAKAAGGATPGAAIVRGPFSFQFDTVGLNAGIAVYTPVAGDILLDIFVQIPVAWDGTTPLIDVADAAYAAAVAGLGYFAGAAGGTTPLDASNADTVLGDLVSSPYSLAGQAVKTVANAATSAPKPWAAQGAISVWCSQDGAKGGTAVGGAQGTATLYIVTATPVAL